MKKCEKAVPNDSFFFLLFFCLHCNLSFIFTKKIVITWNLKNYKASY